MTRASRARPRRRPPDPSLLNPHLPAALERAIDGNKKKLKKAGVDRDAVLELALRCAPRADAARPADALARLGHASELAGRAADAFADLADFECSFFWFRDAGPAPSPLHEELHEAAAAVQRAKTDAGGRKALNRLDKVRRAYLEEPVPFLTLEMRTGRRRMIMCRENDPGAIPWPIELGGKTEAARLRAFAEEIDAFRESLRRASGRPVEAAEDAWIHGFARLVYEEAERRGELRLLPHLEQPTPRKGWFDGVGVSLFEIIFGWKMPLGTYMRNRQRLVKTGHRRDRKPRTNPLEEK